ncbi:hypothetical protein, partial [Streptomyces benahoarensis]|uniref:hypothetical protein n=1 Tax=Streptomyces benahoarensis TaxID=2595054 RepID=UPI001C8F9FF7
PARGWPGPRTSYIPPGPPGAVTARHRARRLGLSGGGPWNDLFEGIGDWMADDYHTGWDELREMPAAEGEERRAGGGPRRPPPARSLPSRQPRAAAICRAMIVVSSYAVWEAATDVISAWS